MTAFDMTCLLQFFSEVVGASSSNKMDAKNLAIVLAPTLPPPAAALHRKSSSFPHSSTPPEDAMLTTNVEILQVGCWFKTDSPPIIYWTDKIYIDLIN